MDLDDISEMAIDRPLSPRPRPPPIDPDQLTRKSYESRHGSIDQDVDYQFPAPQPAPIESLRNVRSRHSLPHSRAKRLSTSNKNGVPLSILPSAPASPPTPAPSPTPFQRAPSWHSAGENEDAYLSDARRYFVNLSSAERQRYLAELLNMCDSNLLSFVHSFVSPRLKKDPFEHLPDELCLRVCNLQFVFAFKLIISGSIIY
jgi:F-box and WD-40 domain protein CDC4